MLVTLDGAGPLYQQLYRAIREAILGAKRSGGSRLPSTRSLSMELGLSRNVVLIAYEQLLAEGYLSARRGSGTFVASELPEALTSVARARSPTSTDRSRSRAPDPALDQLPHLSSYAQRIVRESSSCSGSWRRGVLGFAVLPTILARTRWSSARLRLAHRA